MAFTRLMIGILFAGLLMTACSGTKTESSWANKDFKGKIKNVYIIGIAKSDFNRMYFENTFHQKLKSEGVKSIPSSIDLPKEQDSIKDLIIQNMKANGCDSVLLTKVTNQHTVAKFTSDKGSYSYVPGPSPYGVSTYNRPSYYGSWSVYYDNSYRSVYEQPTDTNIVILTVESVLYDLQTEDLIWSATMETRLEENIDDMIQKFVDEAVSELKEDGLI